MTIIFIQDDKGLLTDVYALGNTIWCNYINMINNRCLIELNFSIFFREHVKLSNIEFIIK